MRSSLVWVLGVLSLQGGAHAAPPPELLCAQGVRRYQEGDLRGAVPLLRSCSPAEPSSAHYLGLALIRLGQLHEGRRVLAAAAREAGAPNPRLLFDLGLAYLAEENTAWAVRTLSRARDLAPEDGRVRYHLGLALLRMGEASSAIEELTAAQRSGAVDPELVALQLGLALYQSGRYAASRRALSSVHFKVQRRVARQLLREALEAEGVPAGVISAELQIGLAVDTNPLYEHETTAPTAIGPALAGSLVLRPWVDAKNSLWGELAGARTFYFPTTSATTDKNVRDASPTEVRASAFYARRIRLLERACHLQAGYGFGLMFLDGPPPMADAHHIFLEEHGGHLSLQQRGGSSQSKLRYSLTRLQFAELARSNWGNELSLENTRSLLGERLRLISWLSYRHELASSDDYTAAIPGVGAGASLLGPLGLVLGLRLGYEHRNYFHSANGRWSAQRIDNNLDFTAEIGRALPRDLRLRLVYRRLQNFSSVVTFDYHRDLLTLSLSWSTS
jgi:Flp pilus assembly protein TadD